MTDRKTDRVTERHIDRQTTDSDGQMDGIELQNDRWDSPSYRMTDETDLADPIDQLRN